MKKIVLAFLLLSVTTFAQKSINNYKYVIVPKQFEFLKSEDQYQTSSLTKFLFNKYGYTAFLSDETLPQELAQNRCLALLVDVKNNSGMFTTKNTIELKDCNNSIVYTSEEGKSKEKEYKKAYQEAIRSAFKSIQRLNYKYVPLQEEVAVNVISKPEIVKTPKVETTTTKSTVSILYAQPTANGFQLVNTTPEVVFKVLKTNIKDVYVIKDSNGILYKNGSTWIAEYNLGETKIIETYEVKF